MGIGDAVVVLHPMMLVLSIFKAGEKMIFKHLVWKVTVCITMRSSNFLKIRVFIFFPHFFFISEKEKTHQVVKIFR